MVRESGRRSGEGRTEDDVEELIERLAHEAHLEEREGKPMEKMGGGQLTQKGHRSIPGALVVSILAGEASRLIAANAGAQSTAKRAKTTTVLMLYHKREGAVRGGYGYGGEGTKYSHWVRGVR